VNRSRSQHVQAGAMSTALAVAAILVVPTPAGRITAVVFIVAALVLLLVAPAEQ
jgi:hypothetical protein